MPADVYCIRAVDVHVLVINIAATSLSELAPGSRHLHSAHVRCEQPNWASAAFLTSESCIGFLSVSPVGNHYVQLEFVAQIGKPISHHVHAVQYFNSIVRNADRIVLFSEIQYPMGERSH